MTEKLPSCTYVPVNLGHRSYDIIIGQNILKDSGTLLKDTIPSDRVIIITDAIVAPLYLEPLTQSLKRADIKATPFIIPAGEASKSFAQYEQLAEDILKLKITRKDTLIALGGGVIGDLTGFLASTLLRGIPFVQIPTTLLAQVDSSVGGKTGINTKYGKNLVGAFYQPLKVLIDVDVLTTLPKRELLAGYAEVVKYGLIDQPEFFGWLQENGTKIISGDQTAQIHAIATSCRAKATVVAEDEKEQGRRALLNLGHTFGHALEAECGYDGRLLHGEAVATGMVLAFQLSVKMGLCPADTVEPITDHLKAVGLATNIKAVSRATDVTFTAQQLTDHMGRDKKNEGQDIVFILAEGIGQAVKAKCRDLDQLHQVLTDSIQG